MLRNYLKVALRNFSRNKVFSFINIAGLSIGMAVTILIGLWIWDELSFNKQFENYNRIAEVMQSQTFNGETGSQRSLPYPIADELRKDYGSDFKYISMASWNSDHVLTAGIYKNIPHAYLWVVPNSGHATLREHRDEFDNLVNNFFTKPFESFNK